MTQPRNPAAPFRPLVIGTARSGFVLLTSIAVHLAPMAVGRLTLRQRLLNGLVDTFGMIPAEAVVAAVERHGLGDDLVYNPNFRKMVGGPKWLSETAHDTACFRKYVGIRGLGDFLLLTSHPRETLEYDDVVHSHITPTLWLDHPGYADHTKFASVRNPIGIVNSALFSLNALASEYIQRFMAPEKDNDLVRQRLALYKFTDLTFYEGIVRFYKKFFDEFSRVADRFILMRWEDLILEPAQTIARLGQQAGLPVDLEHAAAIWAPLDHVNLTGAHKHNYRSGKGIVGDWKNWMTNHHLDILRSYGFEPYLERFGYGPIPTLDESRYTPFQRAVDEHIRQRKVFRDYGDQELFGFAFNKSNIDASQFSNFKVYDWKKGTRVERSDIARDDLVQEAWAGAEAAVNSVNTVFRALLDGNCDDEAGARAALMAAREAALPLAALRSREFRPAFAALGQLIGNHFTSLRRGLVPAHDYGGGTRLVRRAGEYQILVSNGQYYGVPNVYGFDAAAIANIQPPVAVFIAPDYATVLEQVQAAPALRPDLPVLVQSTPTHDIVRKDHRYWGIPTGQGGPPVARGAMPFTAIPGVLEGTSPGQILSRIARIARGAGRGGGGGRRAPRLEFLRMPRTAEAMLGAVGVAVDNGARRVLIRPFNDLGEWLSYNIGQRWPDVAIIAEPPGAPFTLPPGLEAMADPLGAAADVVVLAHDNGDDLAAALPDFLDLPSGRVIVPDLPGCPAHQPLFVVAIPKAGTHMVFELARALGYADGGSHDGAPQSGSWYYLEHANAHTAATDFFVDSVRRAPFGMRNHPFLRAPVLFNYRHPLDIVISEANYYHIPGNSPFGGYFAALTPEQRLLRLLDDPWLLGSLPQRVGKFVPWLSFANVIPVSYEEMVGQRGGGDDAVRRRLVWSLLLKLQLTGCVEEIETKIFNPHSPTFREGRIGNWRRPERFPDAARAMLPALGTAVITAFGYAAPDWNDPAPPLLPRRIEEFRRRRLVLDGVDFADTPILMEASYLGLSLIQFRNRYFAVPRTLGQVDLTALREDQLALFPQAETLDILKAIVQMEVLSQQPRLIDAVAARVLALLAERA